MQLGVQILLDSASTCIRISLTARRVLQHNTPSKNYHYLQSLPGCLQRERENSATPALSKPPFNFLPPPTISYGSISHYVTPPATMPTAALPPNAFAVLMHNSEKPAFSKGRDRPLYSPADSPVHSSAMGRSGDWKDHLVLIVSLAKVCG